MREYYVENGCLYLEYTPDRYSVDEIIMLVKNGEFRLSGVFYLDENAIESKDDDKIIFKIGEKMGQYYFLKKEVFEIEYDFGYHETLLENKKLILKDELFIQARFLSVVEKIISYVKESVLIVDDDSEIGRGKIPISYYISLIKSFPNQREILLYKYNVISSIIGAFFDKQDDIKKYNNFVNKHRDFKSDNLISINLDFDIRKYELIIKEIKEMLKGNYSEIQWQKKLLPLICLLYPKYVVCLEKVRIKCGPEQYRELDYLLVDSDGNADIIELKKPFEDCILRKNTYRNNYVPGYELIGSIQQTQKYLYYLSTYKYENEMLIKKYKKAELHGIEIKLINPKGLIFCGRSKKFDEKQKQDFEIIKRQYNSILDIITYDELIERLENTIKILKAKK